MDALDGICDPGKYFTYNHPPPEMKEGCEAVLMDWEEV
eukprot:CAMPEP_0205815674 /NCGR_PEP_ID=MMETSP0205-20121125/21576_1 /ASSEMBLY_ACC=CAM_ASM_000278 /TAXON_ID=36767 /ORGANISM="Euplotes focardii, Strain TN1" /LENGTH=37 /DNA_ID= /DNA_START= /DNA_END= /DNA_ORIENTATION=